MVKSNFEALQMSATAVAKKMKRLGRGGGWGVGGLALMSKFMTNKS